MKKLRTLGFILRQTKADRILLGFVGFLFLAALLIWVTDPNIDRYGDALWYCFSAATTIGFGDVTAVSFLAKLITVVLSCYAVIAIAIVSGVVVNFYTQILAAKQKATVTSFVERLQHLPELSREELTELSEQAREFVKK